MMANLTQEYYYVHMKLSVLVDNNTLIDRYYIGEPGVSYFIETEQSRVLFDVGYSDVFLRNAHTLGIDLLSIDTLVLSHGHIDHTGGLDVLLKEYMEARFERNRDKVPRLVAHPEALLPKFIDPSSSNSPGISIGSTLAQELLSRSFHLYSSREPLWLDDSLVFLGEIERIMEFEQPGPIGYRTDDERTGFAGNESILQ